MYFKYSNMKKAEIAVPYWLTCSYVGTEDNLEQKLS